VLPVLTKAEQFRRKAEEAEAQAVRMTDLAAKEASLEIARLWREMAAQADRNKW
jgi:hypothetical protein